MRELLTLHLSAVGEHGVGKSLALRHLTEKL